MPDNAKVVANPVKSHLVIDKSGRITLDIPCQMITDSFKVMSGAAIDLEYLRFRGPYMADINNLEQIKSKRRLIVMDALKMQYKGGQGYRRCQAADYGTSPLSAYQRP